MCRFVNAQEQRQTPTHTGAISIGLRNRMRTLCGSAGGSGLVSSWSLASSEDAYCACVMLLVGLQRRLGTQCTQPSATAYAWCGLNRMSFFGTMHTVIASLAIMLGAIFIHAQSNSATPSSGLCFFSVCPLGPRNPRPQHPGSPCAASEEI